MSVFKICSFLFLLCFAGVANAQSTLPRSQCIGGEWNFGRAPQACSLNGYGDEEFVDFHYGEVVFEEAGSRSPERARYMTELNAVIESAARSYLQRRKPAATEPEVAAFVRAIKTTASGESYWSHYRRGNDQILRMMRGDFGHGFGMMQVDDRSHRSAILRGVGADLVKNMFYAMDIYFTHWQRWPNASCFTRLDDYYNRTRAAWSAYNGGPSRICRWTNPDDTWARNDRNFRDALDSQPFVRFVSDPRAPSSVDVDCLIDEKFPCSKDDEDKPITQPVQPVPSGFARFDDVYCSVVGGSASECLRFQDRLCLNPALTDGPIPSQGSIPGGLATKANRYKVCPDRLPKSLKPGAVVQLKKNINLRSTPGGSLSGVVQRDSQVQVIDFEFTNTNRIHLRVLTETGLNYIFTGTLQTHSEWVELVMDQNLSNDLFPIASVGEWAFVANARGINLRSTPGGQRVSAVPPGSQVLVQELYIKPETKEVFYKIESRSGLRGYIYTGNLDFPWSFRQWTRR